MTAALLARPPRTGRPWPAAAAAAPALPDADALRAQPLRGPFATPPDPHGLTPTPATEGLVRTQVRGLLEATPAFHQLAADERAGLEEKVTRVAAYAAECLRDIYWQSQRLGQTPVLKETRVSRPVAPLGAPLGAPLAAGTPPRDGPVLASAQANDFQPRAASQIGNVTQQTLRAIAFPTFVADLIRGTFDAIFQTNIKQMEAFSRLLSNVSKTVDQFMEDNITDDQAHGWLAQTYPRHLTVRNGKAVPREGADQLPAPDFERELHVGGSLDESSIEETLLPAARRRLAETRLQMLSTMVLMGINRIVVTAGKIRATMGFHIDTSDSAFERTAEDLDARAAMRGHYNALVWGVEASASLAYVTSKRAGSDADINVETDLTGEVELHFKSDYFPVERFAPSGTLQAISNNTAVPQANPAPMLPPPHVGAGPQGDGARFASPRTQRRQREAAPATTPVGAPLPEPRLPSAPGARGTLDPGANRPVPPPTAGGGGDTKPAKSDGAATKSGKPGKPGQSGGQSGAKPGGSPASPDQSGASPPSPDPSEGGQAESGEGAEPVAESAALAPASAYRVPARGLPWTVH